MLNTHVDHANKIVIVNSAARSPALFHDILQIGANLKAEFRNVVRVQKWLR